MICKEKKDIVFINDCNAIVDEKLLRSAICWYSSKPVCKFKHIYMYGNYPAVSIYDKKIHIHRLIKMYLIGTDIEKGFYVHHKDGNKLNATEENLEIVSESEHQSFHNKDKKRYQTVWAKHMGSAAAPTASLNMTEELLEKLQKKGVIIKYLTLHVGLGTFLPIRSDKVEEHHMHSEWFNIPDDTIDAIKNAKRVVAVGTTVARTLEYYAKTGKTEGEDDIFIYPGFEFKIVDALVTNFHAPKSTVLMLASAFAGWENLHNAYGHAVKEKYNFLSYGDSMFIC